jgi:transcriptional regulator with XRE-family HTH domain
MRDSDTVAAMRRELGRQLANRRKAAGYVQRELGVVLGYSRTAIANAETGGTRVGRQLWASADRVLGTGELFARGYDRIRAQLAAESRAAAGWLAAAEPGEPSGDDGLRSLTATRARQALLDRGWPVEEDADGRLWLVTGTIIDALEAPRPAGVVAMSWWLYTRGVPDEIRGLPALSDPAVALAVISTGPVWYFLARSGACPWIRRDAGPSGTAGPRGRWCAGMPIAAGCLPRRRRSMRVTWPHGRMRRLATHSCPRQWRCCTC